MSQRGGLTAVEAQRRIADVGRNEIGRSSRGGPLATLAAQFKSPLLLILVFAAAVSALSRDWLDSLIVITIIAASAALSFTQEYAASRAVDRLLARVGLRARLLRDGRRSRSTRARSCPATWYYSRRAAWFLRTGWCSKRTTSSSTRRH